MGTCLFQTREEAIGKMKRQVELQLASFKIEQKALEVNIEYFEELQNKLNSQS